jgi:alpha-tubulin suppressor-like RCC1 family protein
VYCWGLNSHGQLGIGSTAVFSSLPLSLSSSAAFKSISCGDLHCCAIATMELQTFCWGDNSFGQIGSGVTSFTPSLFPELVQICASVNVVAGAQHSCSVCSDDKNVYCWGSNVFGIFGSLTSFQTLFAYPIWVQQLPATLHISSGSNHICLISTQRSLLCQGSNLFGQLGTIFSAPHSAVIVTNVDVRMSSTPEKNTGDNLAFLH